MCTTQWPICELNKTFISFPYSSCVSYRKYRSVAISHNFIKLVCYWSMVDLWKHIARQFCQCSKLFRMVFSYISVVLICLFSFKKKEFFATNLFRMILFFQKLSCYSFYIDNCLIITCHFIYTFITFLQTPQKSYLI